MRVNLLCDSQQNLGGGFSFMRNLGKGLKSLGHQVVDSVTDADVALVSGATMVNRDTIREVKERGVKLVLRCDNIPRNSRNRNTGTSRLFDFAQQSDAVVYQSKWAQLYLWPFIKKQGTVIYNGVDTDIFNQENVTRNSDEPVYLYSKFSKDPTKNWWEAWYKYQFVHRDNPKSQLWIVGQLPQEMRETMEFNWDFYNGEKVRYLGIITDQNKMAEIYKSANYLMAVYFVDCYANTYLESALCGCELFSPNMSGGTPELLKNVDKGEEYNGLERMTKDYIKVFEEVLNHGK